MNTSFIPCLMLAVFALTLLSADPLPAGEALARGIYPAIQDLEYLRAFITSRMGWAQTGGLLIISGAFGAFRRRRVLEIGGYLTGTGIYRKDTVGEDMELVVRLRRHLYEQKIPHKVEYVHTANCWTEIPSRFGGLMKQRDRWNRGACCAISLRTRDGRS